MYVKKIIIIGFTVLLAVVASNLIGCGSHNIDTNFSDIIENEDINNLSLSIYYVNPYIFTLSPWSIDDLINSKNVNKVVIKGRDLEEHIDLLGQINNADLIQSNKNHPHLNVRLYYALESKKNGKILDVAMWGDNNSIFVNGLEVNGNDIFYDVIMPFLPEDVAKEFKKWKNVSV